MPEDLVTLLGRVPLFTQLRRRELESLARTMHERTYAPGEKMTAEGERGVGFFVILDGTATVDVGGVRRRTLHAGDHFGEIALIDEGPRTASIAAESEVRAAGLTSW